jgi:hypothetical protein
MPCTRADFISLGTCFTQQNFGSHDQMAILVFRLAMFSDSVAGTGYVTTLTTTLLTDTNNATCGMTDDQIFAAAIGTLFQSVSTGNILLTASDMTGFGTTPYTDKDEVAVAIACLKNVSTPILKKMVLFLICKIWAAWAAA